MMKRNTKLVCSGVMTTHNKLNPFLASIKERYCLSHPSSSKDTQHLILDLKGSNLVYEVGDSLGVFPVNDPELVERTLLVMKSSGTEQVKLKNSEDSLSLREFLERKANITEFSRKFVSELFERQTNSIKKEKLQELLSEGQKEQLKEYIAHHELWDVLLEHEEAQFSLQELCDLLMPLLPRLYSISSAMITVGDEVHLTIVRVKYTTNQQARKGVCTHFLCELVPLHTPIVPIYIQPHHGFTLPEDPQSSLIMIGPGTGVAPFRAFMQARHSLQASGKNWLFFGGWNRAHDFFYEEFWKELESLQKLHLHAAFSRDQEEKIYVQHLMLEKGEEFFKWLQEGAYIYVCGDAQKMAKDVEATLLQIIQFHGKMEDAEAKAYLKALRSSKRYLRDVY